MTTKMSDFLEIVQPDATGFTLTINPQRVMIESIEKQQAITLFDDDSVQVDNLGSDIFFDISLQWDVLLEADSDTIFATWASASIANGRRRTFKWQHPTEGTIYIVRFTTPMTKNVNPGDLRAIQQVTMRVVGLAIDSTLGPFAYEGVADVQGFGTVLDPTSGGKFDSLT